VTLELAADEGFIPDPTADSPPVSGYEAVGKLTPLLLTTKVVLAAFVISGLEILETERWEKSSN